MSAATPTPGDAGDSDDTRLVRRDAGEDTRSSDTTNDQTRVVDRRSVDDTRVVDGDDEATRLSNRGTDPARETDPDRTQLSTRSPGEWAKQSRARAASAVPVAPPAPPASAAKGAGGAAAWAGVSRPPDAPVGSITSYGVRAPELVAAPFARREPSPQTPPVDLPASAEQIRHDEGTHARRRSVMAISLVVLATVFVAGVSVVAIWLISTF